MTDIDDLYERLGSRLIKYRRIEGVVNVPVVQVIQRVKKEVTVNVVLTFFSENVPLEVTENRVMGSADIGDKQFNDFEKIFVQIMIDNIEKFVKRQKLRFGFTKEGNRFAIT